MDCVRQRIATSENVEPVTRTACAAWRRTPSSAAAATSRPTAPVDDLRESLKILEDTARIARRVLGAAHPVTAEIMHYLRDARATLSTRGTRVEEPGN